MARAEVLRYPHPILKQRGRELDPASDRRLIGRIATDLSDTMRALPHCVGLAAPQIGALVRLVAVDVTGHPRATAAHGLLMLVNPRIVRASGAEVGREGCLSIPDFTANVQRATHVVVEALTTSGHELTLETEGFEARALQHELDHLDGILFLDRITSSNDLFARRRYT